MWVGLRWRDNIKIHPFKKPMQLNPNEIHLWHFNTENFHIEFSPLSPDEKARAEQFYFAKDRTAFSFSRAMLRTILSRYLDLEPNLIRFNYTSHGKPFLDPAQNPNQLHFNLSHTHQTVIYAISKNHEVGIDIEHMNPSIDYIAIAKNFFSHYENHALNKTDDAKKCELFYRIWTCKEAFIKAIGLGLSYTLHDFDVGEFSEQSAKILQIKKDSEIAKKWSLFCWHPEATYIAALAIKQLLPKIIWMNEKNLPIAVKTLI
jgi:4'-phosphopantetheinyl transferase